MAYLITEACTGCTACAKICPTTAISGERKGLHVIDADICIECGACGRICPFNAVLNEEHRLAPMLKRTMWLKPVIHSVRCVSCGACIQACPVDVLEFDESAGHPACPVDVLEFDESAGHPAHLVPFLKDERNCIGCSFCQLTCPVDAISMGVLEAV